LPVVEKDKVVGLITYRNIIEASPSAVTTLSIHEANYLIMKLKVKDLMRKDPILVSPEDSNFDVLVRGHEMGIGSFPVVENGKLVGIVTESEIFQAMIHLIGPGGTSDIITLENIDLEEKLGEFSKIATLIEKHGTPVLAIFSLPHREQEGHRVFIRIQREKLEEVAQELVSAGYTLQE